MRGFTLIELMITMGIFAVLFGFVSINLLGARGRASLSARVDTMVSDLKQQQIKAMTGDTEGRDTQEAYGIHFETNQYTLFHGTYNSSDTSNFLVTLSDDIRVTSINLPSSEVVFEAISGEVLGFDEDKKTITLTSNTGEQKTITINRYGVVIEINE